MTATPPRRPRRGGPPTYTPETSTARAEGKITTRLTPEEAAAWRAWAADHGGLAGLARWLLGLRDTLEK